jgi:hypothetical protein
MGKAMERKESAKDMGGPLMKLGFEKVSTSSFKKGDVVVFQAISGHPHGHIQMYNG